MSVIVNGVTFTGDPCRVVSTTFNGRYVKAGERTMAHLFDTDEWMRKRHGCWIYVIQSAYNTGVAASAGTHDYDAVLDVLVINTKSGRRSWIKGQRRLRARGWYDWWRHTGSWYAPSTWHHHMISGGIIGVGCRVGYLVPGQCNDYLAKPPLNGLAGHSRDYSWHPENIASTHFDFDAWMKRKEQDVGYAEWEKADKDAFWADFATRGAPAVWNEDVNSKEPGNAQFQGKTFRGLLKEIFTNTKGTKA